MFAYLRALVVLIAVSAAGCATVSPWEQAGAEFGKGMAQQLEKDAPKTVDTLMKSAGEGIRNQVLTPETNEKLQQTVQAVGESAKNQVPAIRDELLGQKTDEQLQKLITALLLVAERRSHKITRGVMDEVGYGLRDDVLNDANQKRLNEILNSLGETTRGQAALMRDELLSERSDRATRVIVATAMDEVVKASEEIRQKARDELSFAQKNATELLLGFAALGALIAVFIWRQNQKNRMLLSLLMAQIQQAAPEDFDKLQAQAQQLGVLGPLKSLMAQLGSTLRRP